MPDATGKSVPTIRQVASLAGVALSSVSRVLNDHPDVSAEMRGRVLDAVAELGYEPDFLASSLRRGSSRTVGFLVSDIANPLFADIFKAAERELRSDGYSVVIAQSEGEAGRDVDSARLLRGRRVDGIIVSVADETLPKTVAGLRRLDIPLVLLDREMEGLGATSAVVADHQTGVRRATKHLLNLGHRRIALIAGTATTRPARERERGFRNAFARMGLTVPEHLVRLGGFATEYGQRCTEELLGLPEPPTAILAGGNLIFVGVVGALHRRGMRPGVDLAVITCDDVPLAQFHAPPITVVSRDTAQMGTLAARLMIEQLTSAGQAGPRVEVVPTELIVRESTPHVGQTWRVRAHD